MKIAEHFTTSDGQEFYKEDTARNHAKTLSNKKVTAPGEEITEIVIDDIEVDSEELVAPLEKYEGPTIILNKVTDGDASEDVIVEDITPEVVAPEVVAPEVVAPVATTKKENKSNTKK